ncbi:extracellular solute-binding protein [Paenibacillus sp. HN-1]|uniref:ABC transporter substrate-binding protein n=1 Tax=Paenibacillus TaxID=44249 RepID=UPI001CA92C46|nr:MULTISPECIES: extracellular solute-binding protein [Paenibacillus]MBY9078245.1 extracellular solute-binding protein [Paenibacillus sp. CGMCC 1.18879]MBY9086096.1 extracellular solute-binding protein [Paenibacillus sinensis]
MSTTRKLTGLALPLALSVALTACGSGASESGSGNSKDTAVKLGLFWWGSQARHDATMKATQLYTEKNPNITFNNQYADWDGYWKKLPTLAASGSLPDIMQMDAAYIQEYVKRGTLEPLDDMKLEEWIDSSVLEKSKINGKLYGVPISYNGTGFAFNKPALEAAGIKLPVKDWTWDDFFAFAREGREKLPEGKYAIGDYSNIWDWYQSYQASMGKGPMFIDGVKFNLDKELWFKFNETYADFRKEGIVPDAQTMFSFVENDPTNDPLTSGAIMTRGVPVGAVSALDGLMPGQLDTVNNPVGPAGGGWAQSTIYLTVSSKSEHKEQAKTFLKWFINDSEAGNILGTTRGIPINTNIFKQIEPTLSEGDKKGVELYNKAVDKALPFYPAPPGWADFVKTYKDTMEQVMFNKLSLEKAYDIIDQAGKETESSLDAS